MSSTGLTTSILRTIYLRITFTGFTIFFCTLSLVHCLSQGVIQSVLYSADADSSALVSAILQEAHLTTSHQLPWLQRPKTEDGTPLFMLSSCSAVPMYENKNGCNLIYDSRFPADPTLNTRRGRNDTISINAVVAHTNLTAHRDDDGVIDGVMLFNRGGVMALNQQCLQVLVYADQVLNNAKREEIVLIASQFWLFMMSFYGVMYESSAHILAALASRVLATGWSAYAIWRTRDIHKRFIGLITGPNTPCQVDLFPNYFLMRSTAEIPDLVLNCCALLLSAYCSFRLVKLYNMHTLQRVCPTANILRLYRFFMGVSACLHLSIFYLFVAMGLWIDQLANGAISRISTHTTIYVTLFIFTTVVLVPWLFLGHMALVRESRILLWTFQAIAFVLTACWALMFYSRVFRWTFIQWPFFGCVVTASFMGIIMAAGWAEVGRRGFGSGLRHFLQVNTDLSKLGFEPEVFAHAPEVDAEMAHSPLEKKYAHRMSETFLPDLHK